MSWIQHLITEASTKEIEFGKLSKTMFLQERVHSDIFNQGKLLLNGLH